MSGKKLSRDDVLKIIEQSGGPDGADFCCRDLSGIDLSSGVIQRLIERSQLASLPLWATKDKWEHICVNLEGAQFRGACLVRTNFSRGNLRNCDFRQAEMREACLANCEAEMARFSGAKLEDADFHLANLRRTRFGGADLRGAKLTDADLRDAYLLDADLSGARLMGVNLGDRLIQEGRERFSDYLVRWGYQDIEHKLGRRYRDAREIYRSLKAAFLVHGYAEEAGRLHLREGKANKWTHWPFYARYCYPVEFSRLSTEGFDRLIRRSGFYVKHTISFCGALIGEVSCGFGERPWLPLVWALVVLFAFAGVFWLTRGVVPREGGIMKLKDYVVYSFAAFASIDLFNYQPICSFAKFATVLEALCGVSTVSLFMFALGVKFARS